MENLSLIATNPGCLPPIPATGREELGTREGTAFFLHRIWPGSELLPVLLGEGSFPSKGKKYPWLWPLS